jgi:hypothetical protein
MAFFDDDDDIPLSELLRKAKKTPKKSPKKSTPKKPRTPRSSVRRPIVSSALSRRRCEKSKVYENGRKYFHGKKGKVWCDELAPGPLLAPKARKARTPGSSGKRRPIVSSELARKKCADGRTYYTTPKGRKVLCDGLGMGPLLPPKARKARTPRSSGKRRPIVSSALARRKCAASRVTENGRKYYYGKKGQKVWCDDLAAGPLLPPKARSPRTKSPKTKSPRTKSPRTKKPVVYSQMAHKKCFESEAYENGRKYYKTPNGRQVWCDELGDWAVPRSAKPKARPTPTKRTPKSGRKFIKHLSSAERKAKRAARKARNSPIIKKEEPSLGHFLGLW